MTEALALTPPQMLAALGVLALTLFLFVTEILRVDVAAILVMVILGLAGLVSPNEVFSGFASDAVISIIAVMILGAALDKTGIMNRVAQPIVRIAGRTEARLVVFVSGTVGVISSFMQNIGAAALFCPRSIASPHAPASRSRACSCPWASERSWRHRHAGRLEPAHSAQ